MFAKPDDLLSLGGLGGTPFEELLFDLVVAECSRHGIPPSRIVWDHRTTRADGGRDIIVEATHSDPNPRFIPQRPSIWSAKLGRDGTQSSTLRKELNALNHDALRQHLRDGNPYVWCTLQPLDADQRQALRETVEELAREPGSFLPSADLVEFRTLPDLCTILNNHPGFITKHLPAVARIFGNVLTISEWEARESGFNVPWVNFSHRQQIVDQVRTHLRARTESNVMHLAGLSGIGKTRTVLEACRGERDLSNVFYVPRLAEFREAFLRYLTRTEHLTALIVVDEVPLEDLRSFTNQVENFPGRLRFITVGPAHRNERGRPNILILPAPETREGVLQVVRQAGAVLHERVQASIADYSAHDLRLALMLVEATRQDGAFCDLPIQDGDDVWRRVVSLFRSRLGDADAFQRHYPFLTIAIDVGVEREMRHELEYVAAGFAVAIPRLDEVIAVATQCGLGLRTPLFFGSSQESVGSLAGREPRKTP